MFQRRKSRIKPTPEPQIKHPSDEEISEVSKAHEKAQAQLRQVEQATEQSRKLGEQAKEIAERNGLATALQRAMELKYG